MILNEDGTVNKDGFNASEGDVEPETFRHILQGLTLNSADEMEAYARSLFGADYQKTQSDIQRKLDAAQRAYPKATAAKQLGGALIPTAASMLAGPVGPAAVGTTLARASGTLAGQMGLGTAFGGLSGYFGADEDERVAGGIEGAATGFATVPAFKIGTKLATIPIKAAYNFVKRRFGPQASELVARQLLEHMESTGLEYEEVLQKIEDGFTIPELSNTAMVALKAYIADGALKQPAINAIHDRKRTQIERVYNFMKDKIGTKIDGDDNVLRYANKSIDELKRDASEAYDIIFENAPPLPKDTAILVNRIFKGNDSETNADIISQLSRNLGADKFYKIGKDGQLRITRTPTLREMEKLRATLRDVASSDKYRNTASANDLRKLKEMISGEIDNNLSPDLALARKSWEMMERSKEAFENGRRALRKGWDQAEIDFAEAERVGGDVLRHYRMGVASAIREKSGASNRGSFVQKLNDTTTKEGSVIAQIFPSGDYDELADLVDRAVKGSRVNVPLTAGSPTAPIGAAKIMSDTAGFGQRVFGATKTGGIAGAGAQILSEAIDKIAPKGTSQAVKRQIANLLVTENADVIRRAIEDPAALQRLQSLATNALVTVSRATTYAPLPTADVIFPNPPEGLSDMVDETLNLFSE